MSDEPRMFRLHARWYGKDGHMRSNIRDVPADDACEALDWALPGQWTEGEFDSCEISISPLPAPGAPT